MTWDIAVVGAGYVGVPLAYTFAEAGQRVLLVDVQPHVVEAINNGVSHIEDVPFRDAGKSEGADLVDQRFAALASGKNAFGEAAIL